MNFINRPKFLYNTLKILFVILLTYNCSGLPGINREITKQKGSAVNLIPNAS